MVVSWARRRTVHPFLTVRLITVDREAHKMAMEVSASSCLVTNQFASSQQSNQSDRFPFEKTNLSIETRRFIESLWHATFVRKKHQYMTIVHYSFAIFFFQFFFLQFKNLNMFISEFCFILILIITILLFFFTKKAICKAIRRPIRSRVPRCIIHIIKWWDRWPMPTSTSPILITCIDRTTASTSLISNHVRDSRPNSRTKLNYLICEFKQKWMGKLWNVEKKNYFSIGIEKRSNLIHVISVNWTELWKRWKIKKKWNDVCWRKNRKRATFKWITYTLILDGE